MRKHLLLAVLIAGTMSATLLAAGRQQSPASSASPVLTAAKESAPANPNASAKSKEGAASSAKPARINPELSWRIEGEKRFHANCGRCHAAPQKFPPRAMATIIRHMRVRATITDEDMRLILKYMTE